MREQDLLRAILTDPPPGPSDGGGGGAHIEVVTGPGDDCAVIKPAGMGPLLVTVDQVVDGLHVTAASTPWDVIGHKAVRRSVSDIAAMAGRPLASVISVVLPPDTQPAQFESLRVALGEAAAACGAPLVGGDIAVHKQDHVGRCDGGSGGPLTLSVTVLGVPTHRGPVLRSGGVVDDRVWTTGVLGRTLDAHGGGHHLHAVPRVDVALALHEALGTSLHAMIDISDGLGRDGARLAEASRCTMLVRAADVPRRNGATWQEALHDGEDYELLFAAAGDAVVPATLCGVPMTCVGTLKTRDPRGAMLVELDNGDVVRGDDAGWDHGE